MTLTQSLPKIVKKHIQGDHCALTTPVSVNLPGKTQIVLQPCDAQPLDIFLVSQQYLLVYYDYLFSLLRLADPSNCAQFFLCSGPSGTARVYECPSGYAYNPLTTLCKRRVLASDCIQINCTENHNRFVAYSGDRGYYAYCLNTDGVSSPIMFKCPDFVNFKFDQETQQCQLECQAEGRVADYANCRGYYDCFRVGFSHLNQREDCGDFAYDPSLQQCVPGPCVNTSSVAITTTTPRTTT